MAIRFTNERLKWKRKGLDLGETRFTIAFDFDGVLAQFNGWKGKDHFGEPVPGMRKYLTELKAKGVGVIIYSTRGAHEIEEWCKRYDMPFDYINCNPELHTQNMGKPIAHIYVDDRAICFHGDVDRLREEIANFKPWSSTVEH